MATPEELRLERLRNDHLEMQRLDGDVIRVRAEGNPPERYRLLVRVRSIIGPGPEHRLEHEVQVDLRPSYPWSGPPEIRMLTLPVPFHPNWFVGGLWCGGLWNPEEGLAAHVLRMVKTLQFDPEVSNPSSPAYPEAAAWFRRHQRSGFFPCDRTPLPDPTPNRVHLLRLELLPADEAP